MFIDINSGFSTLKSSSDHPYELTYLLSKHIPETDVNQACCAAGN